MSKQWALGKAKVSPYAEWMMLRLLCELDGAYLFFQPQQRVRSKAEQRLRRMNGMEEEETVVFCWSSNAVARALGLPEELAFAPQGEAIARVLLDAPCPRRRTMRYRKAQVNRAFGRRPIPICMWWRKPWRWMRSKSRCCVWCCIWPWKDLCARRGNWSVRTISPQR